LASVLKFGDCHVVVAVLDAVPNVVQGFCKI
jgi:hypothetical protein